MCLYKYRIASLGSGWHAELQSCRTLIESRRGCGLRVFFIHCCFPMFRMAFYAVDPVT